MIYTEMIYTEMSLLCMMYELKQLHLYERIGERATRQGDKYIFQTDVAVSGVYARSPYYIGSKLWNSLTVDIQNARSNNKFKCELKTFCN